MNIYLFRELIDSFRATFEDFDEIAEIRFGTIHFYGRDIMNVIVSADVIMRDDNSFSVEILEEFPHDRYKRHVAYEGSDIVKINNLVDRYLSYW
jgi:hypothetical protein